MRPGLGQFVAERLEARRLSLRAFARAVELTPSYVSKVLAGTRPLRRDRVAAWAAALDLRGAARHEFEELVLVDHCPDEVREVLLSLRQRPDWPGIRMSATPRRRTRNSG